MVLNPEVPGPGLREGCSSYFPYRKEKFPFRKEKVIVSPADTAERSWVGTGVEATHDGYMPAQAQIV